GCQMAESYPSTTPPPILGLEYCRTVSPLMMCEISESPHTTSSAFIHCSGRYVFEDEFRQWPSYVSPSYTISVPGEHMLPVERGAPSGSPARNCISTDIGQFCSFGILRGSCE